MILAKCGVQSCMWGLTWVTSATFCPPLTILYWRLWTCCEHHGVNCEDCSLVWCPVTINTWSCLELICHPELPSHSKVCIWMCWNIRFSTLEMNWQFSSCPCSVLLLAANGHTQSPDWMLFHSSQNAVYPEVSSCGVHCPWVWVWH